MDLAHQAEDLQTKQQWRAKCQWAIDQFTQVYASYPEVRHHLAFNVNIPVMYKDGERFCHPTRDANHVGTHMFRLFLLFIQLINEIVTHISVPNMSEHGDIVFQGSAGANAGGAAIQTIDLDDKGNPILDSVDQNNNKGRLSEYGMNIVRLFNKTMTSLNLFFDGCDSGQVSGGENSTNKKTDNTKKNAASKKRVRPATTPSTYIPMNLGTSQKTRILPAVEVLFEKVMACEKYTRDKCIGDLQRENTKKTTYIQDEEQEENAGIMEMTLQKRRRQENSVYDQCASWHGFEYDYDNEDDELNKKMEDAISDLSKRAATLWSADAYTLMNDPKFCAFSEICELLDGRSVTDITIHVILRVNVNIHSFLQRIFAQNNFSARLSNRNTSTLTKMQNRYLMRGGIQSNMGAAGIGDDEPEAQKKEPLAPRPNTMQLKPTPLRQFEIWEKFREVTSPVDFAAMVGCYSKRNLTYYDIARYTCDRSFDFSANDPCHALNAFGLQNALRNRDENCHPLQSLDAWLLKPDLYINYDQKTNGNVVLNMPLPQNLICVNPEEITPSNVVFKYLPTKQSAERGFFGLMHPTFLNTNEQSKLIDHYHPITYPYDPNTVTPVRIGERMLTIQETEQAKVWLDRNGWDWRKRPSEARQSKSLAMSVSTDATESMVFNESSSSMSLNTSALMNALGMNDHEPTIIGIIRACPLPKLYKSVREHMSSLIKLQHQLACEIIQQRKMLSLTPLSMEDLKGMVDANILRHGKGIADRSLKYFGGMFRPDDHPELSNGPERDGYLLNQLRTSYLRLKKNVTDSLNKLSKSMPDSSKTSRAILRMMQLSGCDTYDKMACGQYSNISDFDLVLVEYASKFKMYDASNRKIHNKFDVRKSTLTNLLAHFNYEYSTFWHCLKPSLLLTMFLVSLDCNRHSFSTRFNMTVVADGAKNKSHALNLLIKHLRIVLKDEDEEISLRSTSEEISAQTECATKVHMEGRRNGGLSAWHEFPRKFMASEDENGGADSVWKDLSDKGYTVTYEAHIDEKGRLILRARMYQHEGSTICLINWDMSKVEPPAIQRCMWFLLPKSKTDGDTVQGKQAQAEQSIGTYDDVMRERSCKEHHFLQIGFYHTFSLERQKIIHISTTLAMYIILTICDDLAKNSSVIMNPRATTYLTIGSRILMLLDVLGGEFATSGGRYQNKELTTARISALEPFFYVTTEHIVTAVGMFSPMCMVMGQRETRMALKEIFEQEIILRQSVTAMFRQIFMNASDVNETSDNNQQSNTSLFSNTMDRRTKHDFNYVRIPMSSLEAMCDRVLAAMQDLKTVTNTFSSRTISYILYNLSKSFVYSHHWVANPNSPASRPIIDNSQPRKNILVLIIQPRCIEVSYEFLMGNNQDPELCIIKSLRKLFNAYGQEPREYAWKTRDVCSNVIETIWLGQGLGSKNVENNKPSRNDPETHELILPHVGSIIPELFEHIYETPEERERNEYKTKSAIKVDVELDMWAAFRHHEKINFRGNVSTREMMREMWKFGDRLANIENIETVANIQMGSSNDTAIPEKIMQFAKSAMQSAHDDDDIPEIVRNVLNTYPNTDDIDLPEDEFTVPVFRDDATYMTQFTSSRRPLKPIKRVPHWEALGMSREQYKIFMTLPRYREDRVNRHHAANGFGHLQYPQVVKTKVPRPVAAEKQEENTTVNTVSKALVKHYGLKENALDAIFSGTKLSKAMPQKKPPKTRKTTMHAISSNDPPNRITPASAQMALDLSNVFGDNSTDSMQF